MSADLSNKRVVIDGATGYLGSHLTAALSRQGAAVSCLVRNGARQSDIDFLESQGARVLVADLPDQPDTAESVADFFQNADCAVHLIGSIAPGRGQDFSHLHREMTRRLVEVSRRAAVQKIIMVTALGTSDSAVSQYHRSKWEAEQEVIRSGLPYTILRPSLLIGRQVGERDSKLVRRLRQLIATRPFVPLIEGGANKVQPLFIGDMVEAIVSCIDSADNQILELGGPRVVTMRELVELLGESVGVKKPVINLPAGMGRLVATAMEAFQDVPTLSRDQVTLSLSDNICRTNSLPVILNREGSALSLALNSYRDSGKQQQSPEPVGSSEER